MFTRSLHSICRSAGPLVTLCGAAFFSSANVVAQQPTVFANTVVAVPNLQANGTPWQSSVSNRGDFILYDFNTSGLYQFPPNGGDQVTLAGPGVIAGGFSNSGIAVDPRNNNIYLNNNYNGGLIEFPFKPRHGSMGFTFKSCRTGPGGEGF